jgi:hypothetical protein
MYILIMSRIRFILPAAMLFVAAGISVLQAQDRRAAVFYVSAAGNDSWSGTAPAVTRTGGPFATLTRAREAVRRSLLAGFNPSVLVRGGLYRVDTGLILDSLDSGTDEHPVTWGAFPGETVRFIGGRTLSGFNKITDPSVLKRIQPAFRDSLLVADLRGQGIRDFGTPPNHMNLFFRGARQQLARYPNRGWLSIAGVPLIENSILHQGDKKVIKDGLPAGRHSGMFAYDGDRPSRWASQRDIWMHGYWVWDWRDAYQKIDRIDTILHLVHPAPPHHGYGYQKGQRYCFLNVLEELDSPGEWALDSAKGLLYYWPPSPPGPEDVTVSLLKEPMVFLQGVSNVVFRGFTFESSRACAVKIRGGRNILVAGCFLRNIDNDTCLVVDGGTNNGVRSCDISDVGSTGIRIVGGDKASLEAGKNYAINNHISRYGQVTHAFNGGIYCQGVGNIIAHNRIHDAPFSGIQYYGNDHLIEYNDLFDLAHESGDVGGINTGGDYSDMGTVIRYNYIHDTHGYGEGGFRGIYLDLPGSNTRIFGNVLANVDIGVFFNSGRDNLVENNLFVNCHPSVNIYIWPHMSYFRPGGAWNIVEKLHALKYTEPPYSVRYPKLPSYLDSTNLGMPYGHEVVRNVSLGGTWLDLSEEMDFSHVKVENNVVGDSLLLVLTRKWTPDYDPYHIGYAGTFTRRDSAIVNELRQRGNILADPGVMGPGDLRLKESSPAWKVGFQPIPVEKIGLVVDEFRRSVTR